MTWRSRSSFRPIEVSEWPGGTAAVADEHVYLEHLIHANTLIPSAATCERVLRILVESGTGLTAGGRAGGGGIRRKDRAMGTGPAPRRRRRTYIHRLLQQPPKQSLNSSNHRSLRPHMSSPPFLPPSPLSINDQLRHFLTLQPPPPLS
ncbi:hypothetical protein BJ912DRAFT_1060134 [Pholiota molesta]|nr:hypothetical protein BJ912DRAFT_1060134 [Pholiota molesta]